MKTEFAASLAKDFDKSVLKEIAEACRTRAAWCHQEAGMRENMDKLWSHADVSELRSDAMEYTRTATALEELIKA